MEIPDYRFFDADNHYYETRDCFTRFIEPRFRDKAVNLTKHYTFCFNLLFRLNNGGSVIPENPKFGGIW